MRILLVEDEATLAIPLSDSLRELRHEVIHIADASAALAWLGSNVADIVVSDVRLPNGDGMQILKRARELNPPAEVLMMTGFATIEQAVSALKDGAFNYLQKPFTTDAFIGHIGKIVELRNLQSEVLHLRQQATHSLLLSGKSPEIESINKSLVEWSENDLTVLIVGSSGTGKERAARALHKLSPIADKPFVAVSCAAIPSSLFEGELFGYRKGAFSGADSDHSGLLSSVNGGVLFLDDIDDIPFELQSKILRTLQESEYLRIGEVSPRKFSGRVIAASKRPLMDMVTAGEFREDLFHRLNVLNLNLPTLASRPEDIPVLLSDLLKRWDVEGRYSVSSAALKKMCLHDWPGNVRELENSLRRAIAISGRVRVLQFEHFINDNQASALGRDSEVMGLREVTARAEAEAIRNALRATGGRKAKAAELLGITRKVLWSKMSDLGLD
ncbi:MAG: sigma-54 dependent transcriptional regulator [Planctomycetota bacterium]|jgi:DNA-binding NtrC family response regulator|nr:sigma-54 dependent transcriptional regulator [Planctomycetota bacterium]